MGNKLLRVETDPTVDAVYIQLLDEPIGYSKELDDNRLIDYTVDDKPVGVDLLSVSEGVKLEGLPEVDTVKRILTGLGIRIVEPSGADAQLVTVHSNQTIDRAVKKVVKRHLDAFRELERY